MLELSKTNHRLHFGRYAVAIFGSILLLAGSASAAQTTVGTAAITKLRYFSDAHGDGEAVAIDMTGTTACNGLTSYGVPLDNRNSHIYSGLVAAFLAGKQVQVVVESSSGTVPYTGSRCTIIAIAITP
jgi:hypothetical protein